MRVVLSLLAAASLAIVASAEARPRTAVYEATLKLRLTSTWRVTRVEGEGWCRVRDEWSGTRLVVLQTARPVRVRVSRSPHAVTIRGLVGTASESGTYDFTRPASGGTSCAATNAHCRGPRARVSDGRVQAWFVGAGRVVLSGLEYVELNDRPRGCRPDVPSFRPDPRLDLEPGRVREGGFRSLSKRIVVDGDSWGWVHGDGFAQSSSREHGVVWTLVLRRR